MLRRADTIGVFQVESRAQMATLPRMKPECFYDLVIEVAIIRPGPIVGGMVHPYLNRRNKREPIRYLAPGLEEILGRTLGVPLFQEQLLRMAMAVADFTAGEAEELRRAMGFKRSAERMEQIERKLRAGIANKGVNKQDENDIVRSITSFALFGFPESHAASFALIAYASAYLKYYHPAAFFAAMLNCYPLGFYHPATLIKDAERHGVKLLPIDVTHSNWSCTIENGALRLGLRYVGGLREETGKRSEAERARAPFESMADFSARVNPNRRELDILAYAGAFASFGMTRRDAMWQAAAVEREPGSLLARVEPRATPNQLPAMSAIDETTADYAATGMTTRPHLMAYLREGLKAHGVLSAEELPLAKHGSWVKTAGVVIVRQRPGTAKGFVFITLEDETGISNLILLPGLFQQYRALLRTAKILYAEGVLQTVDGVTAIKASRFRALKSPGALPASHDFH
jgi:error-prone DNA polymerase